jgi:hypothetical protein
MATASKSSSGGMNFTVHVEGADAIIAKLGKISAESRMSLAAAMNIGAKLVETAAKEKVRVKTSRLKGSIHTVDATPESLSAKVVADTVYAAAIEGGAVPHVIVPVNATVLHFVMDDEDVFAQSVNHPGNPPFPFMKPSLDEHEEDVKASIMLALQMEFLKL